MNFNFLLAKIAKIISTNVGMLIDFFNGLANWKAQRLGSAKTSELEVESANYALEVDGLNASQVATTDHTHTEYYRSDETVTEALAIVIGDTSYTPSELALANHEHPEYIKKDQLKVAANSIEGVTASQLAPADHNHDSEYFKHGEIADAAYTIGGFSYSDFAPQSHSHDEEYYKKTDIVEDAQFLVDSAGNIYSASDLAKSDHKHEGEYFTLQDFMSLFLMNKEPYWVSRKFKLDVYDVVPLMNTLDPRNSVTPYELLQDPYSQVPLRPEALVNTQVTSQGTFDVYAVLVRDIGLNVGSYTTYNVELPNISNLNIVGGLISVRQSSATSEVPVQLPVVAVFSGSTIGFYAPPFKSPSIHPAEATSSAGTVVFDVLLFVTTNTPPNFNNAYLGTN